MKCPVCHNKLKKRNSNGVLIYSCNYCRSFHIAPPHNLTNKGCFKLDVEKMNILSDEFVQSLEEVLNEE